MRAIPNNSTEVQVDRRTFLRNSLAVATVTALGPLLAACGDDASSATTAGATTASTAAPTTAADAVGGTIRAAFVGAGASETLNVYTGGSGLDFVRARALHATLGNLDPSSPDGVAYGVLEGIDGADDLSSYTLRVRPGVVFSDGSPLGAADVLHSLRLAAADATGSFSLFVADFDLDAATLDDDLTLTLPTRQPINDGRTVLCIGTNFVLKEGTTEFTEDMATSGPFLLREFDPGVGTRLDRNPDFYGLDLGGGPYVDTLELRSIPDEAARLNALLDGQVDLANDLSPLQARELEGNDQIVVEATQQPYLSALYFQMNMAFPPFDDVRVRQAFRLACDREAMLETVLFGQGAIGNDMFSLGFSDYAAEIPQRPYDPDEARRLLADAGAEGLSVPLLTGPESPGMVEAATLYAQQLGDVGVNVTINELPAGQLFADFETYLSSPLVSGFTTAVPALLYYQVVFLGGGPFALGWNRPDVDEMIFAARGTADPDERIALAVQAQQALFDEGNAIIPVYKPVITGRVPGLTGIADGLFEQFPSFSEARLA